MISSRNLFYPFQQLIVALYSAQNHIIAYRFSGVKLSLKSWSVGVLEYWSNEMCHCFSGDHHHSNTPLLQYSITPVPQSSITPSASSAVFSSLVSDLGPLSASAIGLLPTERDAAGTQFARSRYAGHHRPNGAPLPASPGRSAVRMICERPRITSRQLR